MKQVARSGDHNQLKNALDALDMRYELKHSPLSPKGFDLEAIHIDPDKAGHQSTIKFLRKHIKSVIITLPG